jgi:hypothetical protein
VQAPVFARVVAMAEPARAEIIHEMGIDPARVVTIDNASMTLAETERLAHARDATARTRPGRHYLAVGRLAAQKNFRLLIDAFARIATARDSLTIVGEGADRGALERQAAALGIVDRLAMPGHINPIDPYLAEADALVLSSDYEGLGIVVIEALAAGLQVVATDCGPNMAMLVEEAGRLVPIRDQRWVLGHLSSLTPAQVGQVRDLGLVTTTHTNRYVFKEGHLLQQSLGAAREDEISPLRSLVEAGVPVSLATDNVPVSMFWPIWQATTRINRYTGQPVAPRQALSRSQALRCATVDGAMLTFDETRRGSITAGRLADLMVVDRDPLSVDDDALKDLRSVLTMAGGNVVWQAQDPAGATVSVA